MSIGLIKQSQASVPVPPVGEENLFIDSSDDKLKKKLSSGLVVDLEGIASGVSSFNGRIGMVVPATNDYSASQIQNTPAGDIVATNVQSAIDELDSEKAPIGHVGAGGSEHPIVTGSVAGFMSPSDKTKIDGVQAGATQNDTDANLKNRANHTGTQTASTISDFSSAVDAELATQKGASLGVASLDAGAKIPVAQVPDITSSKVTDFNTASDARITAQKGAANGIAPLDVTSKIPATYLPSYIDDVLEYADIASFPVSGTAGIMYVALDTNKIYRWSGSTYIEISASPGSTDAVPEGSSNLYFTNSRARNAAVDDAIVDGVANIAPSQNAVYDALQLKSDMLSLTGEVTALGSGAVSATVSNAAVIAKVLTGFAVDWNIITAADSILQAINKLAGTSVMSLNVVNANVVVPTGYTWFRSCETSFDGAIEIDVQGYSVIEFI